MKKIFYTLASLAVLAGCAKEAAQTEASMKTIDLTLRVDQTATKVAYDGDSQIKWLAGDDLAVIIAPDKDAQANKGAYQYSKFTIGSDLENPVFLGKMQYMDNEALEQMWVYGVYPNSAIASAYDTKIHGKQVVLPSAQTFSQTSWDGKADVMAIEPVKLTGTPGGTAGYYSWQSDLTVKFAHVFGFGCLSFAGLPAEVASEDLTKVIITATNSEAASKPMAGTFTINLENDITLAEEAAVYSAGANNTIVLSAAEPTAVKDSKVWFVAAPGTYDVTITAITSGYKMTFERKGLVIERAKIAKPVLNLKETDIVASSAVDVTGKSWIHNATAAYAAAGNTQFFKNGTTSVDWGTNQSDLMEMNLSYVGAGTGYYGTPQSKSGVYAQDLNYSAGRNLSGVTVTVASSAAFLGMKTVKVAAGEYSQRSTGDQYTSKISVYVTDAEGKHQIGSTQTITGSTATRAGEDFYFEAGDYKDGVLSIEINNFTNNYGAPYISELEINPVPGIVLGSTSASYLSAAAEGKFDCTVFSATSAPKVSVDADWLTASYADGKVSYTVAANTASENREGKITVSASNENGSSSKVFTVTQASAALKEYTLTVTYNDIKDALAAAAQEDIEAEKITSSSTYSFDATVDAVAADGSKLPVALKFNNIRYQNSVDTETIYVYGGYTYGYVENVNPVYAVTAVDITVSKDDASAKLKTATGSYETMKMTATAKDSKTVYSCTADFGKQYANFNVGTTSYSYDYVDMSEIKVTFLND